MRSNQDHTTRPGETRRHFIKKTGMAAATVAGASLLPAAAFAREGQDTVCLIFDPQDAIAKRTPVQWAAGELRAALARRGIKADILDYSEAVPRSQSCILIASGASAHARDVLDEAKLTLPETPEAIAFARGWIGKMPRGFDHGDEQDHE